MKKFILFVVLVVGAYMGYEKFLAKSEAYAAFQDFAGALANEKWNDAQRMAAGQDVVNMIDEQRQAISVLGNDAYRQLRGVLHWGPKFKLLSESYSDDGSRATLKVIQEERRGPYQMAPVGPPTVRHDQTAVMARTDAGWVVEEFDEDVHTLGEEQGL